MTKGGGGVRQMLTLADKGGKGSGYHYHSLRLSEKAKLDNVQYTAKLLVVHFI